MSVAIRIENLSKLYRLGEVGTGTISHDLNRWWAKIRGKDDPYAVVGQENRRDQAATSDYAWALRDINLEVEQGEVLGIIGANGAGKSTLLKLISRITSPTLGSIRAKGRIASLLEVGTGMHPEMTARENIYLNGAILGMKRHEITKTFDEIVEFAGCRMYVDTPVKRYSSGMKVRLGFAVAAHLDPEVLIIDEVLAVGDAEFQRKCLGKLKDVAGAGRTVLFVSHNMVAVRNLCSRSVLLNGGQIVADAVTDAVIQRYVSTLSAVRDGENGVIPLGTHPDRRGKGQVRFDQFYLRDSAGHIVIEAITGQTIGFVATLDRPITVINGRVSMAVYDSFGNSLFVCSTEMTDTSATIGPTSEVVCWLPRIPLSGGEYSVTLFLETHGVVQDWLENVVSFRVVSGDYYSTGRLTPAGWEGRGVLIEHSWETASGQLEGESIR